MVGSTPTSCTIFEGCMKIDVTMILLVAYQIKHFLADYPLQGTYMLGKFNHGWGFFWPLASHCFVHAVFTFVISYIYLACIPNSAPWQLVCPFLALVDFSIHFFMDRVKASPKYLGRFKALSAKEMGAILSYIPTLGIKEVRNKWKKEFRHNKLFWWCLGIDQMVHHLTHYWLIWFLLTQTHVSINL